MFDTVETWIFMSQIIAMGILFVGIASPGKRGNKK